MSSNGDASNVADPDGGGPAVATAQGPARLGEFQCTVCLEECAADAEAVMPCCHREGATMKYCRPCVTIICGMAAKSRAPMPGRCPSCRGFIDIDAAGTVSSLERWEGACTMCRQQRQLLSVGDQPFCEGCAYGMQNRLRYECSRCNKIQMIPHPMWRYQRAATEFSNDTWACHQGCGAQARWRVIASDAEHIPLQDLPASWGRRDDWLAEVRALRRQQLADANAYNRWRQGTNLGTLHGWVVATAVGALALAWLTS